jgi:D-amino-acid dehydrogenase
MVDFFVDHGGRYQQFDVNAIEERHEHIQLNGKNGKLKTHIVVIATGTWSRCLADQLGDDIPLDTESCYYLMLPESTKSLLSRLLLVTLLQTYSVIKKQESLFFLIEQIGSTYYE